jgi:hypothetical protein
MSSEGVHRAARPWTLLPGEREQRNTPRHPKHAVRRAHRAEPTASVLPCEAGKRKVTLNLLSTHRRKGGTGKLGHELELIGRHTPAHGKGCEGRPPVLGMVARQFLGLVTRHVLGYGRPATFLGMVVPPRPWEWSSR